METIFDSSVRKIIVPCILLITATVCYASHIYTDSFPTYDEYDYSILDPEHVYGSPYGGFSRATRSRLAALPLYLPDLSDKAPSDDPLFMEVRDADGRLFVCRVYHEDELDPDSLDESMFNAPKLRKIDAVPVTLDSSIDKSQDPNLNKDGSGYALVLPTDDTDQTISQNTDEEKTVDKVLQIQDKLADLEGICGQIHKGWWSYEVCFGREITQFHIDFDTLKAEIRIEGLTNLGNFKKRIIDVDLDDAPSNQLADDLSEFGRVLEIHDNGGECPETKSPRISFLHLQCCSRKIISKKQGMIHRNGQQLTSDIAAVVDVIEDPKHVCRYNITVCTPLLCGDDDDKDLAADDVALEASQETKLKENETINEILQRALEPHCLQSSSGGWWTYEICHKAIIRQFHEVTSTRKNELGTLMTMKIIETEHILGKYQDGSEELRPWGDEGSLVINSTDDNSLGGSGTYYEVEYTGGEVCDHSDVTDSAIVAGASRSGGLERASSVRYFCGTRYDISVNEDTTCHYIVEVSVPDLCAHPLFREPVSKKQVVKCLPAS